MDDEDLDALPPHLRNKILEHWAHEGEPKRQPAPTWVYVCKIVLSYLWGAPWVILGIALCTTIIGLPLGIACFVVGSYPLFRTLESRVNGRR